MILIFYFIKVYFLTVHLNTQLYFFFNYMFGSGVLGRLPEQSCGYPWGAAGVWGAGQSVVEPGAVFAVAVERGKEAGYDWVVGLKLEDTNQD